MNTTHTRDARGRRRNASHGIAEGMHRPGRGVRRWFVVLVLALGVLLTLSAPAAHAAPTLTASENPVFIPYSTDTKDITLAWTLEAFQLLATLTVTESGTPAPVIDKTVGPTPPPGGEPLTVTYGKTYTAELKDVITQQPLVAPLTITTDRIDIKIDMGCLVQCITEPKVEPHGGWAKFTINTTETASMTLEASKTKPNANGTWNDPKDVAASNATILPTQSWTAPLPNLDSNTTYYYVVRAHDTNGNEQIKTGSFKTLTRRVEVTFAEIQMIDDSDDLSDCDCAFSFVAGNETPKDYGSFENPKSIASGTTVHPNVTFTINNAPATIAIRAVGADDDTFPDTLDWNSWVEVLVSVSRQGQPAAPDAVDEQFTGQFTLPESSTGDLDYNIRGTYKVTYVP